MNPLGIMDQIAAWTLGAFIISALTPTHGPGPALGLCMLTMAVLGAGGMGLSLLVCRDRLSDQQEARRLWLLSWMPLWLPPAGGGLMFIIWKILDALPRRPFRLLEQFYAALIER